MTMLSRRQRDVISLLHQGWRLSASRSPEGTYMIHGDKLGDVQHVLFKTIKPMLDGGHIMLAESFGSLVYVVCGDAEVQEEGTSHPEFRNSEI